MISNYIKTLFRITRRQRVFSAINTLGLAIGMAVFILIFLWVRNELSYDSFHHDTDNIYRVVTDWKKSGETTASTPGKLAKAIEENFPEVELAARVHFSSDQSFYRYEDKSFYEDQIAYVDPEFFEIFNFPALNGDTSKWLEPSSSLIISETIAKKYFDNSEAMGQTLIWNNRQNNIVTGVVEDFPANSHLQFKFMYSHNDLERYWPNGYNWTNFIHSTYLKLKPNTDAPALGEKITKLLFEHSPEAKNEVVKLHLQPLDDVYLNSNIKSAAAHQGNRQYVNIFSIVAIAILFIACINFINLSTARAGKRAREVGVRKSLGASRQNLIFQFFSESVAMAFIAFVLAMLLVEISLPAFNELVQKSIKVDYSNWQLTGSMVLLVLLTGIVSGVYPALYLSSFQAASVLKGTMVKAGHGEFFRKSLVIVQFTVSILLIIGAVVVYDQLYYLQNKNLGFDKENTIYIPAQGSIGKNYQAVIQELLRSPHITSVTAKESLPMVSINTNYVTWPGKETAVNYAVETVAVDYDFMEVMDVKMLEGRNFSPHFKTDEDQAFIVNQKAVEMMGLRSPLGSEISTQGRTGKIIGIIDDVNFRSLHEAVEPQVFYVLKDYESTTMRLFGVVLIKTDGQNAAATIKDIEQVVHKYNLEIPFEYHFLDEAIDQQYAFEQSLSSISNYFSGLAIFISCIGLLGLVSYTTEQKEKELSIRKVLGASSFQLLFRLSREFTTLILVAWLIAAPLGFYFLSGWLQRFAYKVDLHIDVFVLAGIAAIFITLIIIGTQVLRAVRANPADVLKQE